jgi:hypothetical protein
LLEWLIRCQAIPLSRKTKRKARKAGPPATIGTHLLPLRSPKLANHGQVPTEAAWPLQSSGRRVVQKNVAALERRLECAWHFEAIDGRVAEAKLIDKGPCDNGKGDGKVKEEGTNSLVAEKRRELVATTEIEDQPCGTKTKGET